MYVSSFLVLFHFTILRGEITFGLQYARCTVLGGMGRLKSYKVRVTMQQYLFENRPFGSSFFQCPLLKCPIMFTAIGYYDLKCQYSKLSICVHMGIFLTMLEERYRVFHKNNFVFLTKPINVTCCYCGFNLILFPVLILTIFGT